jgi:hypothetical protein
MRDKALPATDAKRHVVGPTQNSRWKNGRFGRGMKCCMGALASAARRVFTVSF